MHWPFAIDTLAVVSFYTVNYVGFDAKTKQKNQNSLMIFNRSSFCFYIGVIVNVHLGYHIALQPFTNNDQPLINIGFIFFWSETFFFFCWNFFSNTIHSDLTNNNDNYLELNKKIGQLHLSVDDKFGMMMKRCCSISLMVFCCSCGIFHSVFFGIEKKKTKILQQNSS